MNTLLLIITLLVSAVIGVALFRALKLPAMLAYFLVGLILGPHILGILPDSNSNREFAEFGIVFLMFSIGLEFSLPQLYAMRKTLVELGGAQVLLTIGGIFAVACLAGLNAPTALVIGAALAMSSTAIVSKMLTERVDLNSRHGRLSIGVLLFQDLAVVPILILIPALAKNGTGFGVVLGISMLKAVAMLLFLFTLGKWLINPLFNMVASHRSRELFVMNVLMVTLLLAYATKVTGLSYSLGAFIAGMLISETRYRYQVESDISPFRDILMGLFFITIGTLLDFTVAFTHLGLVLTILFMFVAFKALIVMGLVRLVKYETGVAVRTGLILAQAGEFSFVILALGLEHGLISGVALQITLAASLLSMLIAPLFIQYNGRIARRLVKSYMRNSGQMVQDIESVGQHLHDHVVVCGYGRSGQYLGRFLREENIPFVALDIDPNRVAEAASAGESVMYGDCGRRVVLEAAGVSRAKAVVVSYAQIRSALRILHIMQERYPHTPVIVRTVDDTRMDELRKAGATEVVPEVLEGSLMLASHALMLLGVPLHRVVKRIRLFREERYNLFRGYFHGLSDAENDDLEHQQVRLHSVILSPGAYAVGRCLDELELQHFEVEVKLVRRVGLLSEVSMHTPLIGGDVIVLLGHPVGLDNAQNKLLMGKVDLK